MDPVTDALAAEPVAAPKPSWRARRAARRIAYQAEELAMAKHVAMAKHDGSAATTRESRARYIAPAAALGTAAALQVAVFTDTVGGRVATAMATSDTATVNGHTWVGYLLGALLGLAVAACAEGGAAHLMDLYERHLLARDSTGFLRLGMLGYVAGSAALIHWWLDKHQFPTVVAWVLAAMTGSSLFLWSRASRWRNREAMRAAGQLDPAMPRLPMAAKVMHPLRWAQTLWLVSWEPAATTGEARARYAELVAGRSAAKRTAEVEKLVAKQLAEHDDEPTDPWDRAVPAGDVDQDRDLAGWTTTSDGRAVVATLDTETLATDVDVDSILATHGLPSDEDMAKAMDMLLDEVVTVPLSTPVAVRPTPRRTESLTSQLAEPWQAEAAMLMWSIGYEHRATSGLKVTELDELVGAHYGMSGRTFRRRREALGIRPVSAQPAS